MRILVIEDDGMLGDAMATGLRQNGDAGTLRRHAGPDRQRTR